MQATKMEMKRNYIPIVTIIVLVLGLTMGCSQKSEKVGEPPVNEVSTNFIPRTVTPKVIEKDVEIKFPSKGIEWLPFALKVGDRVEGEVYINDEGSFRMFVVAAVRDPYENVVVEKSNLYYYGQPLKNNVSPWRFAFIAATNGEYKLGVYFGSGVTETYSAHVKITCYEGE